MTPRQRSSLRLALQKQRAEALRAKAAPIEPNRSDATQSDVTDEDAQALSAMLQVLNSQRNRGQAELVARIDVALRRLEESPEEFGLCAECEEDIPFKRLELMPHATLCAECQTKHDPRRTATRRKVTDFS